ncbi:hypothetical protein Tco_0562065 [Tanacetum coccineum]
MPRLRQLHKDPVMVSFSKRIDRYRWDYHRAISLLESVSIVASIVEHCSSIKNDLRVLPEDRHFIENIRAYNQIVSMTSLGAHVDKSVNIGRGPYVFKISVQLYQSISSLCPEEGESPRILQLYIYDTDNEVDNRMNHFGGENSSLRKDIVEGLIELLDTHNALVRLFRTTREKFADTHVPNFHVRLYNVVGAHEYELQTGDMLGVIVFEPGPETDMDYDIVIEKKKSPFT